MLLLWRLDSRLNGFLNHVVGNDPAQPRVFLKYHSRSPSLLAHSDLSVGQITRYHSDQYATVVSFSTRNGSNLQVSVELDRRWFPGNIEASIKRSRPLPLSQSWTRAITPCLAMT